MKKSALTNAGPWTRSIRLFSLLVFLSGALWSVQANDAYQFILSGYPPAQTCHSDCSPATELSTGTFDGKSTASSLEARFQTWDTSDPAALDATPFKSLALIIR